MVPGPTVFFALYNLRLGGDKTAEIKTNLTECNYVPYI